MFSRKRQRVGSSSRLSSLSDPLPIPSGFDDPSSADVIVRLDLINDDQHPNPNPNSLDLHLHSSFLRRSRFFSALLSDRWHPQTPNLSLKVPSFDLHVAVLKLLYSSNFSNSIVSVSHALELLPVALELLFDDLIGFLISFIEAVPWTDEEEDQILQILPFLNQDESQDLLARVFPQDSSSAELMLSNLIESAIHCHPKLASVKAFVGKILREYEDMDLVQKVLDHAFLSSLGMVRDLLGKYARPEVRAVGDEAETEAMQRLSLHKAVVIARHLLWLLERLTELRVADVAVREWSEQSSLAADLHRTLTDDGLRNVAPGLPVLVMRCLGCVVNAVVVGSVIAPKQVRMKLVKEWLPVLNACRDMVSPMPSGHKTLHQELEETFLQIICTLPMPDAQGLLQQCLSFSTRDVDNCPHLVGAFKTWFRRANRPPHDENAT